MSLRHEVEMTLFPTRLHPYWSDIWKHTDGQESAEEKIEAASHTPLPSTSSRKQQMLSCTVLPTTLTFLHQQICLWWAVKDMIVLPKPKYILYHYIATKHFSYSLMCIEWYWMINDGFFLLLVCLITTSITLKLSIIRIDTTSVYQKRFFSAIFCFILILNLKRFDAF